MSFNAGEIEATATIDRAPFNAGLDKMKADAKAFADKKYSASVDVDTSKAIAKLAALDKQLAAKRKILIDDVDTKPLDDVNTKVQKIGQSADQSTKQINPLISSIIDLGPALVPLTGGVLGLASGLVGLGAVGALAFKGIQAQMTANTAIGQQYTAQIAQLKSGLGELEATAAKGVLAGFETGVGKLNAEIPELNVFVGKLSSILGQIGGSVIGAVVTGFNTFSPLIEQAAGYIGQLAAGFETWANGPGGQQFMQTLSADFTQALPIISQLLQFTTHLLTALEPIGGAILSSIGALVTTLNHIPLPVLTAVVDGLIAMKIASDVATGINLLSAAFTKLAASETEAALAGKAAAASEEGAAGAASISKLGLAAGGAAGLVSGVALVAGAFVGVGLAAGAAANAAQSWATSTNKAQQSVYNGLSVTHDLLTGKFSSAWDLVSGKTEAAQDKIIQSFKDSQAEAKEFYSNLGTYYQTYQDVVSKGNYGKDQLGAAFTPQQTFTANVNSTYSPFATSQASAVNSTTQTANAGAISAAAAAYQSLAAAEQKQHDATLTQLDDGGKLYGVVNGNNVSLDVYNKMLAANTEKYGTQQLAVGATLGQLTAYGNEVNSLQSQTATSTAQAALVTKYQSDVASKYGLTAQQIDTYTAALGLNASKISASAAAEAAAEQELGVFAKEITNGTTSVNDLVNALSTFNSAAPTAASEGALIGAALKASNGDALSYAASMNTAAVANQQLVTDFTKATKATVDWKSGIIDFTNAAAAPLINDLGSLQTAADNAAAATYTHEKATRGQAQAAKDAVTVYTSQTSGALVGEAKQLGITTKQAQALATQYFNTPKSVITDIEQNGADAVTNILKGILTNLQAIAKHFAPTITIDPTQALYSIGAIQSALAALPSTTPAGARQGIEKGLQLTKGTTTTAGANGMMFYSTGGMENHQPMIAPASPSTYRVWGEPETHGEAYIPLANDARRPRAKAILAQTASMLGGRVSYSAAGDIFGFSNVTAGPLGSGSVANTSTGGQIASAAHVSPAAISAAAKARANTISALLSVVRTDAKDTAGQIIAGMAGIVATFAQAHKLGADSTSVLTAVTRQASALTVVTRTLAGTTAALATARANFATLGQTVNSYASSAASTSFSAFDPGTSGQGYSAGILGDLKTDYTNQGQFETLLNQAKKLGFNTQALAQIASEGPATAGKNLQAIVSAGTASKSYVQQYNAYDTAFQSRATTTGNIAASDKYGAAIVAGQTQIRTLTAQQLAETKAQAADIKAVKTEIANLAKTLANIQRAGVK